MPEIDVGFIPKWLPRYFCLLSFNFNVLLIYLVVTQNRCKIGPYRQFLICFALFDMTYSAIDSFVGMASHHYESSFSVFVSHGPLVDYPFAGSIGLIVRCSFISLSYGILEIHFIYRYIALCRPKLIHWFTHPLYITGWLIFWLSFGGIWAFAVSLAYPDEDDRKFLRETFRVTYNVDVDDLGLIAVRYKGTEQTTFLRVFMALLISNIISITVIVSYCVFGYKINKFLKVSTISFTAKRVHRQLFLALVAQTTIPFVVSFLPCMFLWYTPLFGVNLGSFNNDFTIPMFSAFPFCDPIAIIAIFSEYRAYILSLLGVKTAKNKIGYSSSKLTTSLSSQPNKRLEGIKKTFSSIFSQI